MKLKQLAKNRKTTAAMLKEYSKSGDIWDFVALLLNGQSIIVVTYDDGESEYMDEDYYKGAGTTMLNKKRGKQVAKVQRLTSENVMG